MDVNKLSAILDLITGAGRPQT